VNTVVVFAHRKFRVEDRAIGQEFMFSNDARHVLREEFAQYLLDSNPGNLCKMESHERAEDHVCPLTDVVEIERKEHQEYLDTMVDESPDNRMLIPGHPSPVRISRSLRKKIREARHRSRRARLALAEGRLDG
jgi:hypothetical protein